jgi:DNA-binding transcriptional MerR regulator
VEVESRLLVSELVACTGVPLATVKYYLREGLLPPGRAVSATRSVYDDSHARRLGLIKALSGVGLSIEQIKAVLVVIDNPGPSLFEALGAAVTAASPPAEHSEYPRAAAALATIGQECPEEHPAIAQLDRALAAAEVCGVPVGDDTLRAYAPHIKAIAAVDIDHLPRDNPAAAIEYAVLGTILYEPVIEALRRIAHADLAAKLLDSNGQSAR